MLNTPRTDGNAIIGGRDHGYGTDEAPGQMRPVRGAGNCATSHDDAEEPPTTGWAAEP